MTKDNLAVAANHYFSGRGFDNKKTAMELVVDVIKGYPTALGYLELFHAIGRERYDLYANLRRLLEKVEQLPEMNQEEFLRKHKK